MRATPAQPPQADQGLGVADVVFVVSRAIDLVGVIDQGHCARVGVIASMIAERLGLAPAAHHRVFAAGLLHDIGVSSTHVHDLIADDTWSDVDHHCLRGARLANLLPCLSGFAPIIRRHHTPWEDFSAMEPDAGARLASNVVFLADRLDVWLAPAEKKNLRDCRTDAFARANARLGRYFSPQLADAIGSLARDETLVSGLGRAALARRVDWLIRELPSPRLDPVDTRALARLLAAIVDAKCQYTAEHSFRVAAIARRLATIQGLAPDRCAELEVAALLHDVGKLGVPDDILNKPVALDPQESRVMRHHVVQSSELISRLPGLARVAQLARWHHERLDGRGYPDGVLGRQLPLEARILAAADVFQAMTQTRAYRPGLRKDAVRCAMHVLGEDGQLDPDIVDTVDVRFEDFWDLACHREGIAGLDPVLVDLCRDSSPPRDAERVTH